jgi:hypothetical protein
MRPLLGTGRDLDPGDGQVARAEITRIHQEVGAKPASFLHGRF